MEKLKEIIRNNKMSIRPEYYSGRGATTSDLNGNILFGIHRDLKNEFGESAALGFVKMINGIKVLSATAFLNGLYDLYYNNWVYEGRQPDSMSIPKNENGDYDRTIGMIGVMESLFSSGRDDTARIKSHFLYANGIKPTENYNDKFGCVYYEF